MIKAAGIAVLAADSGRVLLQQRSQQEPSENAGKWEFPGGKLEDGEGPWDAAKREWQEETGVKLPKGDQVGSWISPSGAYQGFVYQIKNESVLPLNVDHEDRKVLNPDDPDGDFIEVVAWWDPKDLPGNRALRPEMQTTNWA